MTAMNTLSAAPTATQYCAELRERETALERHQVTPADLNLGADGTIEVRAEAFTGVFQVADEALPDLANLARIPERYFGDCDPELQSLSFNHRVHHGTLGDQPAQVVLRRGVVDRILNRNLMSVPQAAILDTVLNAKPENVSTGEVRAVVHTSDGMFDVSLIVPTLTREPRKGDIVAFGVNVLEARDGAIQVRGAAFRLWCSNGAIRRICDCQDHRLRRPSNHLDRQHSFLNGVASFAKAAWHQWPDHADGVMTLTAVSIDPKDRLSLRSRLSQKPFFLSQGLVDRVVDRLLWEAAQHQQTPSLYDLYNAMTYLGTHSGRLSPTYRVRLRAGAGELGRRGSRICSVCRQLIVDAPTT